MPATEYLLKRSNINSSVDARGRVVLRGVNYFSLTKTFDCGQCFRFENVDGGVTVGFVFAKVDATDQLADDDEINALFND